MTARVAGFLAAFLAGSLLGCRPITFIRSAHSRLW